jgi:hypothetical protein
MTGGSRTASAHLLSPRKTNASVVWFGSPNNIRRRGRNRADRNYYGVPRPI